MKIYLGMLMLAMSLSAAAQGVPGQSKELMKRPADADANLPPSPFAGKPLPELKGVVSWKTLADVKTVKQKDRFTPEFGKSVATLDKQEVRLQGFMAPVRVRSPAALAVKVVPVKGPTTVSVPPVSRFTAVVPAGSVAVVAPVNDRLSMLTAPALSTVSVALCVSSVAGAAPAAMATEPAISGLVR